MITKTDIQRAYENGVVKLDIDPNFGVGTVARIGDNWFYFDDIFADDMDPDEYTHHVQEERIIDRIFSAMEEIRSEDADEYAYYETILDEALSHQEEVR